jgi:F420-dependent oxidoreductase-like protein
VTVKLAINIGYWGSRPNLDMDLILEAERLGYDAVFAAEAWGSDAVTVLSWVAARTERIKVAAGILQMPARTPAMTAMTAVTLNELSGGRFVLGLGLSGPQVVEGWHGVAYGKPLGRTREYVSIVRQIISRQGPVVHRGDHYAIPYAGADATGLGKPLKLITHPSHPVPIHLAALGPRNVALAAEIADGWLPVFYSPFQGRTVFQQLLDEGFAASGEPGKADRFEVIPALDVRVTADVAAGLAAAKPMLALYLGGMGAKGRNFYNDLARRYGYEEAAERVQDLYLGGNPKAAVEAVPDELVDELNLVGPAERIAERLEAWRAAGVTTLLVQPHDVATLRTLAELVL